jgi:hypothetical protein
MSNSQAHPRQRPALAGSAVLLVLALVLGLISGAQAQTSPQNGPPPSSVPGPPPTSERQPAGELVLNVSPLRLELSVDPGQRVEREITLKNAGSAVVLMASETQDFAAADVSGKPTFVPAAESDWAMSGWVTMKPSTFSLRPGQEKTVVLVIDVPEQAEPGGHYAAALFGSRAKGGGDTQVVGKVGTLLLLTVSGAIKESLSVSLSSGRLLEGGPIDLQVRSENTGNVHVRPEGEVTVAPLLWGDERSLPVPGENVLPSSVRESTVRLDQLPIGVYKASVQVTYGSGKVSAASERQTFVVLPWKLLLGALVIFFLGGLGSLGLTRLWGRRGAAAAAGAFSSRSGGDDTPGTPHR